MRCGTSTGRGFVKDVAQLVRGMILSGAAHRKCGGTGAGEKRVDLLTFHHRRAVPSGAVQMLSLIHILCIMNNVHVEVIR